MKALLSESPGGPDTLVLREIDDPVPAADEVRIAVRACGVNYPDALIIEDKYQFKPRRPFAPGFELAGVIDAVGAEVAARALPHLAIGQAVIAHTTHGGFAEKAIAKAKACAPMPPAMPFDLAAAVTLTYGTSLHALQDRARLQPLETLLVLGAAGGVGLAAVELGKALGARVIAAVSSAAKAEVARAHGADLAVVYPTTVSDPKALAALFKDACTQLGAAGGANVIYDPVGGDYAEPALRAIAWQGRYLVVGFPSGIPKIPLNLPLLKGCDLQGVFWGTFVERDPAGHRANMARLLGWLADGTIRPKISDRFTLPQGGEALKKLLRREAVGKIVVTVG